MQYVFKLGLQETLSNYSMKKTIVITGSTRGIGFGLAREFLKLGHNVVLNGTNKSSIDRALRQLQGYESQLLGVAGSVTEDKTIDALINQTQNRFGSIHIWINNAGIPHPYQSTWHLSQKNIQESFDVNVLGLIQCTIRVYHAMKVQGFGKIFNMEGMGSDGRSTDKLTIYGTTKRAVNYFSKAISKEAERDGGTVQIGILSPGIVITDFLKQSLEAGSPEEQKQARKIFNILGDKVETVTPVLAKRVVSSTRNYDQIVYLTNAKASFRFLKSVFVKRKLI